MPDPNIPISLRINAFGVGVFNSSIVIYDETSNSVLRNLQIDNNSSVNSNIIKIGNLGELENAVMNIASSLHSFENNPNAEMQIEYDVLYNGETLNRTNNADEDVEGGHFVHKAEGASISKIFKYKFCPRFPFC